MSSIDVPLQNGGFGRTSRKDNWWVEPLLVFLGFSTFIGVGNKADVSGNDLLCWWEQDEATTLASSPG